MSSQEHHATALVTVQTPSTNQVKSSYKTFVLATSQPIQLSRLELLPRELRDKIYWELGLGTKTEQVTYASAQSTWRHTFFMVEGHRPYVMMRHPLWYDATTTLKPLHALVRTKRLFRDEILDAMFVGASLIMQMGKPFLTTLKGTIPYLPPSFPYSKITTLVIRSDMTITGADPRSFYNYATALKPLARLTTNLERVVLLPPNTNNPEWLDTGWEKAPKPDELAKVLVEMCTGRNLVIAQQGITLQVELRQSEEDALLEAPTVAGVSAEDNLKKATRTVETVYRRWLETTVCTI